MGRPSCYTAEMGREICERLEAGESLRGICERDGMPNLATVLRWVRDDVEGFRAHYTRARQVGYALMAEEIVDIADDGRNDWMRRNDPDNPGYAANHEHRERSRIRIDTRKWMLSKVLPKIYGDSQRIDLNLDADLAARLTAARGRRDFGDLAP